MHGLQKNIVNSGDEQSLISTIAGDAKTIRLAAFAELNSSEGAGAPTLRSSSSCFQAHQDSGLIRGRGPST
jgi:hypothetical protein